MSTPPPQTIEDRGEARSAEGSNPSSSSLGSPKDPGALAAPPERPSRSDCHSPATNPSRSAPDAEAPRPERPTHNPADPPRALFVHDLAFPGRSQWICGRCGWSNQDIRNICRACGLNVTTVAKEQPPRGAPTATLPELGATVELSAGLARTSWFPARVVTVVSSAVEAPYFEARTENGQLWHRLASDRELLWRFPSGDQTCSDADSSAPSRCPECRTVGEHVAHVKRLFEGEGLPARCARCRHRAPLTHDFRNVGRVCRRCADALARESDVRGAAARVPGSLGAELRALVETWESETLPATVERLPDANVAVIGDLLYEVDLFLCRMLHEVAESHARALAHLTDANKRLR